MTKQLLRVENCLNLTWVMAREEGSWNDTSYFLDYSVMYTQERQRGKRTGLRTVSMPTECVLSQLGSGHIVNGHYVMLSPPATLRQIGKIQSAEGYSHSSCLCLSECQWNRCITADMFGKNRGYSLPKTSKPIMIQQEDNDGHSCSSK